MDYEQLYYDSLYKIKKLEQQINLLEEEKEVYKNLLGNKNVKSIIAKDLVRYLAQKKDKRLEVNNK